MNKARSGKAPTPEGKAEKSVSLPSKTILLVVLVTLFLILGIFFWMKTGRRPPQDISRLPVKPSLSLPSASEISPVADLIVSGKTYQNEILGFNFKYPESWPEPQFNTLSTRSEVGLGNNGLAITFSAGVYYDQKLARESTFEEIADSYLSSGKPGEITQSDLTLAGIKGKKFLRLNALGEQEIYLVFPAGTKGEVLEVYSYYRPNDSSASRLFEQILATFKFLK